MSLLPICSKIFKKLIFDSNYSFINKNNLFNNNQWGFTPNDSSIHQLIVITHKVYSAFDANSSLEVPGVFPNLSKPFNRVWHDGPLYRLKSTGTDDNLFKHIKLFLNNKCKRLFSMVYLQSGSRFQLMRCKVHF